MRLLLFLALSLSAFAQLVTVNWIPAVGNPSGVGTNVYRALGACSATPLTFAKLTATPLAAGVTNYVDSAVSRAASYCYRVTAALGSVESAPSGTAEAVIPLGAPTGVSVIIQLAVNVTVDGVKTASKQINLKLSDSHVELTEDKWNYAFGASTTRAQK